MKLIPLETALITEPRPLEIDRNLLELIWRNILSHSTIVRCAYAVCSVLKSVPVDDLIKHALRALRETLVEKKNEKDREPDALDIVCP